MPAEQITRERGKAAQAAADEPQADVELPVAATGPDGADSSDKGSLAGKERLSAERLKAVTDEIVATFDDLVSKPRRIHTFHVIRQNPDQTTTKMKVVFQAMDPVDYDELREAHPPTEKQRRQGLQLNVDTFAPQLIAAVSHTPKLTVEQATQLYTSPNYATGEREGLFAHANFVCQAGVDVPFTAPD